MSGSEAQSPLLTFDHVIVGASDVQATVDFFAELGLQRLATASPSGAFVGLPGEPGAILVRPAEGQVAQVGPYATGGQALDLYTSDLARSLELIDAAGFARGPAVSYAFGPMTLGQVLIHGPDELPVVLVEVDHRLPSALDADPDRLHSQLHSVVWGVTELAVATTFFSGSAGLTLRATFPLTAPEVSTFMELPRPTAMHMSVLANDDARPPRFELLAYEPRDVGPGEGGHRPGRPLASGALLPAFTTTDLPAVEELLGGRRSTDGLGERLDACAPGGVDLEVRPVAPGNIGPFYAQVS